MRTNARKGSKSKDGVRGPPSFLINLALMVDNEDEDIIYWDQGHIIIENPTRLVNEVLGKYFRHNQFASFQRQLHNFGFHKVEGKGRYVSSVYENPDLKGSPSVSILMIQRALPKTGSAKSLSSAAVPSPQTPRQTTGSGGRTTKKATKRSSPSEPSSELRGSSSTYSRRGSRNDVVRAVTTSSSQPVETSRASDTERDADQGGKLDTQSTPSERPTSGCPSLLARKVPRFDLSRYAGHSQSMSPVIEAAETLHFLSRIGASEFDSLNRPVARSAAPTPQIHHSTMPVGSSTTLEGKESLPRPSTFQGTDTMPVNHHYRPPRKIYSSESEEESASEDDHWPIAKPRTGIVPLGTGCYATQGDGPTPPSRGVEMKVRGIQGNMVSPHCNYFNGGVASASSTPAVEQGVKRQTVPACIDLNFSAKRPRSGSPLESVMKVSDRVAVSTR